MYYGTLWNSLPRLLHDTSHNTTSFGHSLTTFSLSQYRVHTAHFGDYAPYKSTFYLITYY